jgi:hypothetical protein
VSFDGQRFSVCLSTLVSQGTKHRTNRDQKAYVLLDWPIMRSIAMSARSALFRNDPRLISENPPHGFRDALPTGLKFR